jgi:outer membrane lipoprotein-sorting protein
MGGEDKLEKSRAMTWKESGTFYGMGAGIPYTGTYAAEHPGKFRMEIENAFTLILDGEKGWLSGEEMTKDQLAEAKETRHAEAIVRLVPLTKNNDFTLEVLPDAKVGDKPMTVIKVSSKGHRDVTLFFDKQSGMLVKSAYKVKDDQSGQQVTQEAVYSAHKDVDGIKVPMKITLTRDGNKFVEAEISDVKLAEKLDDKTFAKP